MKLLRYRVTNFRSVDDSGWIDVDDVTAFVGVNESGKTNLLLPLWKLNPAKEGGIEPTADFPKNNYGAIRANPTGYRFVQAEFDLQEFAKEFSSLTGYSPEQVRRLHIWKNYGDGFIWSFPDAAPPKSIDSSPIVKELVSLSAGIKEAKELAAESGLKEKCLTTIDHIKSGIKDRVTSAEFENLYQEIFNLYNDSHAKTSAIHPRLAQANAEFENVYNIFNRPAPTAVEGAWEAIKPRLPVFLYYSNYGNLDSEIYLPHVVDNLTRTGLGAKEAAKARTLKVLFSFVGLDPKEILELGRDFKDPADPNRKPTEAEIEAINKKKKERSILLQSAGTKLTSKFRIGGSKAAIDSDLKQTATIFGFG